MSSSEGKLVGKVAVVTGGSSGIGAATARLLAGQGCTVAVGYNKGAERARQVLGELPGEGHGTFALSLLDASTVSGLGAHMLERYGRVDILVNSAGYTQPVAHSDLNSLTDEIFDSMLIANVRGPFSVIRALNPLLQASGDGVIVNVSSISAFSGSGSSIAYCASKAALDTMTMSLARALGPKVRAMCVSPGAVSTGFVAGRDRAALEKIAQATPLRRVVEADDVAEAVLACIVNLRSSTGSKITVDGGRFLV
jgi:3-oxoacyl-[acyl-carrier protein] reductase